MHVICHMTLGLKVHLMLHRAQLTPLQQEIGTLCWEASKIVWCQLNFPARFMLAC